LRRTTSLPPDVVDQTSITTAALVLPQSVPIETEHPYGGALGQQPQQLKLALAASG